MAARAYLGDLRYYTSGILANDCMPLGVAYMKAVMDRDNPDLESRLFVYPDRLLDAPFRRGTEEATHVAPGGLSAGRARYSAARRLRRVVCGNGGRAHASGARRGVREVCE